MATSKLNTAHSEPRLTSPNQPCLRCFGLNASIAYQYCYADATPTDQKERVVSVRRFWGDLKESAATRACQVCPVLVEILEFFGLYAMDPDIGQLIMLRIPMQKGNLEMVFLDMSDTIRYVQLYIGMCILPSLSW